MSDEKKAMLEEAIALAVVAHKGQRDKCGAPYILHPLRVMLDGHTWEEKIVGVLHDVVEDTDITLARVVLRFGKEIGDAVEAITHIPNEPNVIYLARCVANPIARNVKRFDVMDNMDQARMGGVPEHDRIRLKAKYEKALEILDRKVGV